MDAFLVISEHQNLNFSSGKNASDLLVWSRLRVWIRHPDSQPCSAVPDYTSDFINKTNLYARCESRRSHAEAQYCKQGEVHKEDDQTLKNGNIQFQI